MKLRITSNEFQKFNNTPKFIFKAQSKLTKSNNYYMKRED